MPKQPFGRLAISEGQRYNYLILVKIKTKGAIITEYHLLFQRFHEQFITIICSKVSH